MTFLVNKLKKDNDEEHMHGIFRKFDDQFIGSVVLKNSKGRVELGYIVGPEFWGSGYASEAVQLIVNWVTKHPFVFRFWANCDIENIASHRVLEKCGFNKEAIIEKWALFPNQQGLAKDCVFYNYPLIKIKPHI